MYVRHEYENIHIGIIFLVWASYKSKKKSLKELRTNLKTVYG